MHSDRPVFSIGFIHAKERWMVECGSLSKGLQYRCDIMEVDPHEALPHPISLTRCGLPRNIPAFHRHMIRRRDDKADLTHQMVRAKFAPVHSFETHSSSKEAGIWFSFYRLRPVQQPR